MHWGKAVLIFQATITLIVGFVFFFQVLSVEAKGISQLTVEITNLNFLDKDADTVLVDLKERYMRAAYILIFVAIVEMFLISMAFKTLNRS